SLAYCDGIDGTAKLLRDVLHERGTDVLPHLDLAREDRDLPVPADVDPRRHLLGQLSVDARPARLLGSHAPRRRADEQSPAQELEELAPVHVEPVEPAGDLVVEQLPVQVGVEAGFGRRRAHQAFFVFEAARCTAARILGYVPHRQMCPDICRTISSLPGFALAARSAAAPMTIPGVQ